MKVVTESKFIEYVGRRSEEWIQAVTLSGAPGPLDVQAFIRFNFLFLILIPSPHLACPPLLLPPTLPPRPENKITILVSTSYIFLKIKKR